MSFKLNREISMRIRGNLTEDCMKDLNRLEKENKKHQKEIEKYLRKTIKYWEYTDHQYLLLNKKGEILVIYNLEFDSFDFKNLEGDEIMESLHERIKDDLYETRSKNSKLLWLLQDIKNFFGGR